mgnify:CR=1 FL=1
MRIPYVNLKQQYSIERKKIIKIIDKTLQKDSWVGGDEVRKFEKKISEICKTNYCISLNSGTDALTLALHLLGVRKGDEVITPPNSFIASTAVIVHLGAKPVFADVDIETFMPSIQYIINQGGKCIRMGDSSMQPCPKIDGLIDYAISPYKSDFMDVFLCSESLFFLGSNSGLFEIAIGFGTPVAISTMGPLTSLPRGRHDLSIPMMHSKSDQNDLLLPNNF